MQWTPAAEEALTNFLAQVPDDWRDRVRVSARKAATNQALQIGNPVVDVDEVVQGYIQATPAHLRPALRPVLTAAGFDVNQYLQ